MGGGGEGRGESPDWPSSGMGVRVEKVSENGKVAGTDDPAGAFLASLSLSLHLALRTSLSLSVSLSLPLSLSIIPSTFIQRQHPSFQ
jgi:hypothetical protein